jgi:hypothetical protein
VKHDKAFWIERRDLAERIIALFESMPGFTSSEV